MNEKWSNSFAMSVWMYFFCWSWLSNNFFTQVVMETSQVRHLHPWLVTICIQLRLRQWHRHTACTHTRLHPDPHRQRRPCSLSSTTTRTAAAPPAPPVPRAAGRATTPPPPRLQQQRQDSTCLHTCIHAHHHPVSRLFFSSWVVSFPALFLLFSGEMGAVSVLSSCFSRPFSKGARAVLFYIQT